MNVLRWSNIILFLVVGYTTIGKSFAYLGIPGVKLFVGDFFLVAFLLFHTRSMVGPLIHGLIGKNATTATMWFLILFICYGVLQVARGLYIDNPLLPTIEGFAFHAYALFFLVGWWSGASPPDWLPRAVRAIGYFNCIYAPLYFLFLNKLIVTLPGTEVPVFGQPGGAALVIIGLLAFEKDLHRVWLPLCVNSFLLLAIQVRSQWVGIILALLVVGVLGRQYQRVALGGGLVAALLLIGFATDFRMDSPTGRGGEISTREIIGRAIASVDSESAGEFTKNARTYAGTVSWRTNMWDSIWFSSNESTNSTLFGHAYGFDLADLVPYLRGMNVRTPHNVFFFALVYDGWLGVCLFFGLQLALLQLLWRSYRTSGQTFGLAMWVVGIVGGLLGNVFETPFGAIPYYLLIGAAAAPLNVPAPPRLAYGHLASSQPLPTSGR
jgi:hypothetical protein